MMETFNSSSDYFLSNLFFHKYKPLKKLGEGSFGIIYMAENITTHELFALKFEDKNSSQNLLESEAYVMSYLRGQGIPNVKSYGYSGEYNILVMELLGKSLEDLLTLRPEKKFSVKTVCMLAEQMINILESIHLKHIIHRDIKPDNFVMGMGDEERTLYLLDFGLARKYRSSTTLQHYPMRNRKKLTGTARYASINALRGIEQSRRDDLEAVGYVLLYFLRGNLPWQGLPVKTKEDRYRKIMEKKQATSAEELCLGFPSEFAEFVNYTRALQYEDEPDYAHLRQLLRSVMHNNNFDFDYVYDWTVISKETYKPNIIDMSSNVPQVPLKDRNDTVVTNLMDSININSSNVNHVNTVPLPTHPNENFYSSKQFQFAKNEMNYNNANTRDTRDTSNHTPTPHHLQKTYMPVDQTNLDTVNTVNAVNTEINTNGNGIEDAQQPYVLTTNSNVLVNMNNMKLIAANNFNTGPLKVDGPLTNSHYNTVVINPTPPGKKHKKENKCCIL